MTQPPCWQVIGCPLRFRSLAGFLLSFPALSRSTPRPRPPKSCRSTIGPGKPCSPMSHTAETWEGGPRRRAEVWRGEGGAGKKGGSLDITLPLRLHSDGGSNERGPHPRPGRLVQLEASDRLSDFLLFYSCSNGKKFGQMDLGASTPDKHS